MVMKKAPRLAQPLLLGVFAILGSTSGVGSAHAGTIPLFTGSWEMQSDDLALRQNQSIDAPPLQGPISSDVTGLFSFIGAISDYATQPGCTPFSNPCDETWSGTFSGGTVSFAAYDQQIGLRYSFTGLITGGSFSGLLVCAGECLWENEAMFSFISTAATNGWSSEGTLFVRSGSSPRSFGTLTMTTTAVPEPGSMTLLGAGFGALATLRRRRRSRVSLG
jgi:hypothetical protein